MTNDLVVRWADQAVSVCWQTALLAGLVWLVTRVFRKLTPATRTWLWWMVMLKAVVGFVVLTPIALPLLPSTESPFAAINDRMDLLAPVVTGVASPEGETGGVATPSPRLNEEVPAFILVLAAAWALGVAIHFGAWARDAARVRRWVRGAKPVDAERAGQIAREIGVTMGLHTAPRVAESGEIDAPMVARPWRPVVLLPLNMSESLSEPELRMVLAHELAHLRRKDLLLAIVPAFAQAILFFWPAHWLARREWSIEREVACDTEAIGATQVDPNRYGQLLLKVVTQDHRGGVSPALGATASYHTLRKRILMMKESMVRPSRPLRAAGIALTALGLLLVLPWQVSARAAVIDNAVSNAGFESGLQGWEQGSLPANADPQVDVSIDNSVGHTGKSSLKFAKIVKRFFPVATVYQSIRVPSGAARIKVNLWAKAENASKLTMKVLCSGGAQGSGEWGAFVGMAKDGDRPANHDWKRYGAVLAVPSGTTTVTVQLEMYGPGTVWVDDVTAEYVDKDVPLKPATQMDGEDEDAMKDIKDVKNDDLQAGGDSDKRYFLIGADGKDVPAEGYKLLVVMPGGDGGADFNPFVRRIQKFALPKGYVVAQLVAPRWSADQAQQLVWPTKKVRWQGMKFSTEEFITAVVKDVKGKVKIDDAHVYSLSWSSSGPAAYAAALSGGPIKGSFIAMSIYRPNDLGPASGAKGHAFYLLHSPEDFIKIAMPRAALADMKAAGARATLQTYEGGHGWKGDVFGTIRTGVEWLEKGN